MSRLLLDANMPHGLRGILSGHQVETAHRMGWDRLTNGDLLTAAEAAGFEVFITADRVKSRPTSTPPKIEASH
jgi:hypothetical protein